MQYLKIDESFDPTKLIEVRYFVKFEKIPDRGLRVEQTKKMKFMMFFFF